MGSVVDSTQRTTLDAISYSVGTDVGRSRDENQDSFGVVKSDKFKIFMVADGMGGVKGGAVASGLAIKTLENKFQAVESLTPEDLASAVGIANLEIFKKGSEDESCQGMGTTFVGLAFSDTKLIISNVGDSRAYRIREDKIVQLTEDHTLVNDLLQNGAITEEQAVNHPVSHMLTRSLGPCADVAVEAFYCEDGPAAGDLYVLCSDGLYNVVKSDEILKLIKENSIDESVQKLIALANERGGPDNITVIVVAVSSSYPAKASDFKELSYPRRVSRKLPSSDAYDIRVTSDPYRSRNPLRELDDAEVSVSATSGPFGKVAPVATEKQNDNRLFPTLKWMGYILVGLIIGFSLSEVAGYLRGGSSEVVKTPLINPLATQLAQTPFVDYSYDRPELQSSFFSHERISEHGPNYSEYSGIEGSSGISRSQMEGIIERRRNLEDTLVTLTSFLNSLESFNRQKLANDQARIAAQIVTTESSAARLTKELADSSKNLANWIERQKKLDSSDPVDMASEVAFSSQVVKERKELFEKATWAYLREVEVWRFNPNDKELAQQVSELGKAREQRRLELAGAIKVAVAKGKASSEGEIARLSAKAEKIEKELEDQKSELDFIKKVLAGDSKALAGFKDDIRRRLDLAQTELSELERITKSQ